MPSSRTVATSEWVVPRSMPTARGAAAWAATRPARRSAAGPWAMRRGQEVAWAAISSTSSASLSRKRSLRTRSRAARRRSRGVEERRRARLHGRRLAAHLVEQRLERGPRRPLRAASAARSRRSSCCSRKSGVERGVGLVERVEAVQRQQVARALDRIAERAVGLVHARRRLQGERARRRRRTRRAGPDARGAGARGRRVERARVDRVARRAGRTARNGCARSRARSGISRESGIRDRSPGAVAARRCHPAVCNARLGRGSPAGFIRDDRAPRRATELERPAARAYDDVARPGPRTPRR